MTTALTERSRPAPRTIVTLQAHILQQQARFPEATGTLSWILSALSISAKMIAAQVRRARLDDVLGSVGSENVQGETAAEARRHRERHPAAHPRWPRGRRDRRLRGERGAGDPARAQRRRDALLRAVRSARRLVEPRRLRRRRHDLQHPAAGPPLVERAEDSLLQPGTRQVAAGYVLYGSVDGVRR